MLIQSMSRRNRNKQASRGKKIRKQQWNIVKGERKKEANK